MRWVWSVGRNADESLNATDKSINSNHINRNPVPKKRWALHGQLVSKKRWALHGQLVSKLIWELTAPSAVSFKINFEIYYTSNNREFGTFGASGY